MDRDTAWDARMARIQDLTLMVLAANTHAMEALVASVVEFAGPDGEELRERFILRLRTKFPESDPLGRLLHQLAQQVADGAAQDTRRGSH